MTHISPAVERHLKQRKYNLPVIGHFKGRSVRFDSIRQAAEITGICHHLIFEACIDKIRSAHGTLWEYENGAHWIHYKAKHIRAQRKYTTFTGFNGQLLKTQRHA